MVHLNAARAANAAFVASQPIVAVFPGGTSGIAAYTIYQLVNHHKEVGQKLRIYMIGRNQKAAAEVIANCSKRSATAEIIFVRSEDLSLLKNVDLVCEEVTNLERKRQQDGPPRVDLLVMSHADLHFGARRDTKEGLDKTMSLLFYSRMRFIRALQPLLLASRDYARVVSIYAGGLERNLPRWYPTDLSLRSADHYSLLAYRTHVPVMTTYFFEDVARQNPGKISLTHIFPGLVVTPAFEAEYHPWWFKVLWRIIRPFSQWFSVSQEEIGERVLFCASEQFPARGAGKGDTGELKVAQSTDGVLGGGAYSVNHKGEVNDLEQTYRAMREDKFDEVVRKHAQDVFEAVDHVEVFAN